MSPQISKTKLTMMVDFLALKKTTEINETEDIKFLQQIVKCILADDNNAYKYDYQNAYNKVYNMCLSGLSKNVCVSVSRVLEEYFQAFKPSLNSLEDFYIIFASVKDKFERLNGLFLALDESNSDSVFKIKDHGMSFLRLFVGTTSTRDTIYTIFFNELKQMHSKNKHNECLSTEIGHFKFFIENMEVLVETPNLIYDQLIMNFETLFAEESLSIERNCGLVEYYTLILRLYQHEYTFLKGTLNLKDNVMGSILEKFTDIFIVKNSSMMLSETMFVSMTDELLNAKINNKYLIDYIYIDQNIPLVDNMYKMYLNQSLRSQLFQVDTKNIANKRQYIEVVSKLTNVLLQLYRESLDFVETKLRSTDNYVNRCLKVVLRDVYSDLVNTDKITFLNVEQNQWFMIIVKYMDIFININRETLIKNIVIDEMTTCVQLLDGLLVNRYETFVEVYDTLLNKRLMSSQGTNIELEQTIIQIMDTHMNPQYGRNKEDITRMGLKIKDYLNSKKTNDKYSDSVIETNTDVKILNEFFWTALVDNENHKLSNIVIPDPLKDCITNFETFYNKSYNTRNIKWLYQYWLIEFDHVIGDKVYTLSMPFVSTIIFYHLINNDYVSVKMLKQLTNLPTKQIVQNLITFSIKYNLITHLDSNKTLSSEKKAINEGDYFTINNEFTNDKDFIKVNVISITKKEGVK
ncbi:hypothetical protein AWRI3578_g3968 [Hanseniaspora opuntiae]|uniref:Cullin family profile domain-containing protein n=1 Tax=Hanseniaspora opuntiae TaxID=211096 RepID=A0A1E5R322_9ASCO|nr:hypothetical protein AWRI3578_g3968 [Hanseniaspora opuntiae]